MVSKDRPHMRDVWMGTALRLEDRSTCERLEVGCVITSHDLRRVLSVGYNGNAAGLANSCDRPDVGACGCLHAEENAVIACGAPRDVLKVVFTTISPCLMCAKRLINLGGVVEVWYEDAYRLQDGVQLLRDSGVKVGRWSV